MSAPHAPARARRPADHRRSRSGYVAAGSIDLAKARIHVNRAKNGESSAHPLSGVELRALRRLKRESIESPFVFVSERGSPFATAGYRKMIARLGEAARFSFPVHPHMFRHACGYKLANDGRDTRALQHYLGHKSIQQRD